MSANHRAPAIQFYWKDWLTDDAVQSMTYDEQGRYFRVLAMTYLSSTPGVCSEAEVQRWADYSDAEWDVHREAIRRAFKMSPDGAWIQKRAFNEREAQRQRYEQAGRGGRASAGRARDSRGQFVAGLDGGLDVQLDGGAGTPASSSASASSERNKTNPTTPLFPVAREASRPRGALSDPQGPEPIGQVLARATGPLVRRRVDPSSSEISEELLDRFQARCGHVDARAIAAQVREDVARGDIKSPRGLFMHRWRAAVQHATARASPDSQG